MTIQTVCTRCRTTLAVDAEAANELVVCGACGEAFVATPVGGEPTARRTRRQERDDEDERPRRRSRYDDEDDLPRGRRSRYDDEDDDWDDRPRRRPAGGEGAAVTSLVLGIVSCVIFCLAPVGFGTSLTGILCGIRGLRSRSRPTAVTGLVLSTVGMIFAVGVGVVILAAVIQAIRNGQDAPTQQPPLKVEEVRNR